MSYLYMCKEQHGFRKYRSCQTQLLEAINDLSSLNAGIKTDLLPLGFSKAFDPSFLQSKLSFYGLNGQLYSWIEDFVTDHQLLNTGTSNVCNILSGVSQGSVLGQLLF